MRIEYRCSLCLAPCNFYFDVEENEAWEYTQPPTRCPYDRPIVDFKKVR